MPALSKLDSSLAAVILAGARAFAADRGWAVSIAVVDERGELIAFLRMDGASPDSTNVAISEARISMLAVRGDCMCDVMMLEGRLSLIADCAVSLGRRLPLRSGNSCIGAIGVAGSNDSGLEQIAQAGVDLLDS